jgi:hypothetical protein
VIGLTPESDRASRYEHLGFVAVLGAFVADV